MVPSCPKRAPQRITCGKQHNGLSQCDNGVVPQRFLTLAEVQEILNISQPQAYALVRSGDLPAIQVGGRGQWRVEGSELEAYIARQYEATKARIAAGADLDLNA